MQKRRRILLGVGILSFLGLVSLYFAYRFILPGQLKSALTQSFQQQLRAKVSIGDVGFSLMRGMVVRNIRVTGSTGEIIAIPETHCSVGILPLLSKKIIVTSLSFYSPSISIIRNQNGTWNTQELIPAHSESTGFTMVVHHVRVKDGKIILRDNFVKSSATYSIDRLDLTMRFALPARIIYAFSARVDENEGNIEASGTYSLLEKKAAGRVAVHGLQLARYAGYLSGRGMSVSEGTMEADADMVFQDGVISSDCSMRLDHMHMHKDALDVAATGVIKAQIKYDLDEKTALYKGDITIVDAHLEGVPQVKQVSKIQGTVHVENDLASSNDLSAQIFGFPVSTVFSLEKFNQPVVKGRISVTKVDIAHIQAALASQSDIHVPFAASGQVDMSADFIFDAYRNTLVSLTGTLDIYNGVLDNADKNMNVDAINGSVSFTATGAQCQKLVCRFQQRQYALSGLIEDFEKPVFSFTLVSDEFSLKAACAWDGTLLTVSECSGRFRSSTLDAAGGISIRSSGQMLAQGLSAQAHIALEDIPVLLPAYKNVWQQALPTGTLKVDAVASGVMTSLHDIVVRATVTGKNLALYGLHAQSLEGQIDQQAGVLDVPNIHIELYEGSVDGKAAFQESIAHMPFWVEAQTQNINLQKLKMDTQSRKQDISGIASGHIKLNGLVDKKESLNGMGNIAIANGKLWNLDLFKGLGSVLFDKDFANIVFSQATSSFVIKDLRIRTDDLNMVSNLAIITGSIEIGFDQSLEATLNVRVSPDAPLKGSFKDITTAVMGQAETFGVIKVSGTLQKPKYQFKAAMGDILKGIAGSLFSR